MLRNCSKILAARAKKNIDWQTLAHQAEIREFLDMFLNLYGDRNCYTTGLQFTLNVDLLYTFNKPSSRNLLIYGENLIKSIKYVCSLEVMNEYWFKLLYAILFYTTAIVDPYQSLLPKDLTQIISATI